MVERVTELGDYELRKHVLVDYREYEGDFICK